MDKGRYIKEIHNIVDNRQIYLNYALMDSKNFVRHIKENHILSDFRQIWKNNGKGEIYNIFDIFDNSSFHNPYENGDFNMMAEGYLLHNDTMFYYKLIHGLNKSLKQYYIINGIIKSRRRKTERTL